MSSPSLDFSSVETFDPEGSGYDYKSAKAAGMKPDQTGHWESRDPKSGLILKGKKHETWNKTEQGEKEAGYEITKKGDRYYSFPKKLDFSSIEQKPMVQVEPKIPNFPFDQHINEQTKHLDPKQQAETKSAIAETMNTIGDWWMARGYSVADGINRGFAHVADSLQSMAMMASRLDTKGQQPFHERSAKIFENLAKTYESNADFWKARAHKSGITAFDEMLSNAIGAAPGDMAKFTMDVDSFLVIPALEGAEKSIEKKESPLIGGLVQALKTGTFAHIMRMVEPFSSGIKATVLGTAGGLQAAAEAPKGQKLKAGIEGGITMAAMGAISPGGHTIRDVWNEIGASKVNVPEYMDAMRRLQTMKDEKTHLRPALKMGEEVIEGQHGETHNDIIARESVSRETPKPEDLKGASEGSAKPQQDNGDRSGQTLAPDESTTTETTTEPAAYLQRVGADSKSVKLTPDDEASVEFFRQQIREGNPIEAPEIHLDEDGNVIGADGRHRALAYQLEGVERIPVKVMRRSGQEITAGEDFYDIDAEEVFSDLDWAREMAPDMVREAQRRTETRMQGEEPEGLQQMGAKELQTVFDLGSAGRGFVGPDGNFMSREEAKAWVKENQPEIYKKWAAKSGNENAEFHSQDYAEAAGIAQENTSLISGDPDIGQLTSRLKAMPKSSDLKQRIQVAKQEAKTFTGVLGKVKTAWAKVKAITASIHDQFRIDPKSTDLKIATGKYFGERQEAAIQVGRWVKAIQEMYPDKARNEAVQEAITKYIRLNGDREAITKAAAELEEINPIAAQKYKNALNLNDEEMTLARNIGAWYEGMLEKAQKYGVLKTGLESYVNRRYKTRPNPTNDAGNKIVSQASSGLLQTVPGFAKKRFYEFDIEAELQGADLEDRIGYLIGAYEQSMDEAIAARAFALNFPKMKMEDGRPIGAMLGGGHQMGQGEEVTSYVINPLQRPRPKKFQYRSAEGEQYPAETNFGDYKTSTNPAIVNALRGHVWATKDVEGRPIFVKADMILHPDALKYLDAAFGKSKFREIPITRAMLTGAGEIKGAMLSLSPFHQVGIGQEVIYHGTNPFAPPEIDINHPITKELIEHGLMVYDQTGMTSFMEGASGPGLLKYIPGVGKVAQMYTDYLFGLDGYIPRMKVLVAHQVFKRNIKRYSGKMSRDEIAFKTSEQVNAITGGINYRLMGRNQTFQDILRLMTLAPDFLEARIARGAQAVRPGGKEQAVAIVLSMLGIYGAAKIIEGIFSLVDPDKNKVHLDRPFSVTVDDKEYSLRSWVGDFYHLLKDQRSFIYYRLNPAYTRPIQWALTGRDEFGRVRDFQSMAADTLKRWLPIPVQGIFTKRDFNIWQSMLQACGISSWAFRTEAQEMMREKQMAKSEGMAPGETRERRSLRVDLTNDFAKTKNPAKIRQALADKKITVKDAQKIRTTALEGDLKSGIKGLTLPESLDIWSVSNDDEKAQIQKFVVTKWINWDATPDEREAFADKMQDVLQWRQKANTKKRFSIRK